MSFNDLDTADKIDAISTQAVETSITATTTAQVLRVGGSNLAERRYVFLQATDNNVKWGFSNSCVFDAFKNQAIWIPVGTAVDVYVKTTSGTSTVRIAEGS